MGRQSKVIGLAAVAFGLAVLAASAPGQQAKAPPVKIGMVSSLLRDIPDAKVQSLLPEFQNLMRDQTGLDGEVIKAGDFNELGKQLNDNVVQFGVFHGFEFAWARQKYPDLQPLVIAVNRHRNLKAFVAVIKDSKATSLADLKGKAISIPNRTSAHCLLFLERELKSMGAEQKDFFGKIVQHANVEDALDDILRDQVQAALVDGVSLENYDQVKPGCFVRLTMLAQSPTFPPGVVAFRKGAIDEATVAKLKKGMISANTSVRGKEQMAQWRLSAFENVPADYESTLGNILKAYPPPATK